MLWFWWKNKQTNLQNKNSTHTGAPPEKNIVYFEIQLIFFLKTNKFAKVWRTFKKTKTKSKQTFLKILS